VSTTYTRTYLVTGVTGFLGKVMLESLIRQRERLGIERILVVIRARGTKTGRDRLMNEVATSRCLAALAPGWQAHVTVLDGDLSAPGLGLAADQLSLLDSVTHVIHSAASVNFSLPVKQAAKANIVASLNLLELVRRSPKLKRFVYVSTAYVTPHRGDHEPIEERLVPLPGDATEMLAEIEAETTSDADWLKRTGYPNTYTLTKAIAERLLSERRGTIPLSIVRPSVITASRVTPFPGWIDSTSGFGAFATMIGLGHLRVIVGRPDARLDLIPVDDVSDRVIEEAHAAQEETTIRHATAGIALSPSVNDCWDEIHTYFRMHPIDRRPARRYLGPAGPRFALADALHHRLPIAFAEMSSPVRRRQAKRLASRLDYLNDVFPYFTTRTFDFRSSRPLAADHQPRAFVRVVCRGLAQHVLDQDERQWTLAGRQHAGHGGDLRWVMAHPDANAWVRTGIWASTKVLRRIAQAVTVDIPSFERARAAVGPGEAIVLVPSHRSYLDFILCSYLAFTRPDLGIRVPYIAAATEFGRVPLLGRILQWMHAFYVKRGAGKENRDLTKRVQALLDRGEVLEFFVEGERSRSREFLTPKRGLLRTIQESGKPAVLFPIAITYDRIPEEAAFQRELSGAPKPRMRLSALMRWLWEVVRGRVRVGRMHLACGAPIALTTASDVREVAQQVIDHLRSAMAVTTFHLDAAREQLAREGWQVAAARERILSQGGHVLESELDGKVPLDPVIAQTMRAQIGHWLDEVPSDEESQAVAPSRAG
jgi:1-acyl-sn-glycerol-3-phosphate acyltransferase